MFSWMIGVIVFLAYVILAVCAATVVLLAAAAIILPILGVLKIGEYSIAGLKDTIAYPGKSWRMLKGVMKIALVLAICWWMTPSCDGWGISSKGIEVPFYVFTK